jgi:hypothetical protein
LQGQATRLLFSQASIFSPSELLATPRGRAPRYSRALRRRYSRLHQNFAEYVSQVACSDFGRRRTFALSVLIEKPNWGEFVIDCYGPDSFDRLLEHEVRSEKRLMVRQIAASQSALQAHKLCYGQTPDRVIARRGRVGSAQGHRLRRIPD